MGSTWRFWPQSMREVLVISGGLCTCCVSSFSSVQVACLSSILLLSLSLLQRFPSTAMVSNTKDAIQYHSIGLSGRQSPEEDPLKPEIELGRHPQLSVKRNLLSTFLIQTACLLWLAPVLTLLVLNFKGHIVGASAWCPNQNCQVGWFYIQSVAEHNLYKLDRRDHNLLGVLQLVAKALEIWYVSCHRSIVLMKSSLT